MRTTRGLLVVGLVLLLCPACDDDGTPTLDSQVPDSQPMDVRPDGMLPDGPAADATADGEADAPAPDGPVADTLSSDGPVADTLSPDGPVLDTQPLDAVFLSATVTDEQWYQGNHTCQPVSMVLTGQPSKVVVQLLQIPAADVPGTCIGHTATVVLAGATLQLTLFGNMGSACWTACWDLELEISGVPPGSYTVSYGTLSGQVTVP